MISVGEERLELSRAYDSQHFKCCAYTDSATRPTFATFKGISAYAKASADAAFCSENTKPAEAWAGIAPAYKSFADSRLATWLPGHTHILIIF